MHVVRPTALAYRTLLRSCSTAPPAPPTPPAPPAPASLRAPALGAYRTLLRAGWEVFEDNMPAFQEFKYIVISEFDLQKEETDPELIEKLIKRAHDMAAEVKSSIVPISLNEEGNYTAEFSKRNFEDQKAQVFTPGQTCKDFAK